MCAPFEDDKQASFHEILALPNVNQWMSATKEEMNLMEKSQAWELVDLPSGRKSIENKWVLKIKCKADGSLHKYKARLMAKGYTQKRVYIRELSHQ